ncbi:protein Wnt-6-like [Daphnia pulex]|nr:protein Wnt-6-like [Daphnia pulex]XP_046642121.1 protein Wnt-6-like [Daphnia pulicaria]
MRFWSASLCLLVGMVAQVCAVWWASASQAMMMEPMRLCRQRRVRQHLERTNFNDNGRHERIKSRQVEICRKEPKVLQEIVKGAQLGTKECQHQFRNRRWNCTTARKSLRKVIARDTRETAFVNAVVAAGVTYTVTQACSSGHLLQCTCDKTMKGVSPDGDWEWGGCADNVQHGYKKSREFMDAKYRKRSDLKTQVMLHNNEAGRLAVKNFMRTECKCHGLSGSCTLRTCWRKLPLFRDVATRLKEKFDGAAKVIPGNDGKTIIPEVASIKPPGREDLIYSEESPDFCNPDRVTGSLGTAGRVCNSTSPGVEGCELLCCGRGYETRTTKTRVNCHCRFKWCCEVTCKICTVKKHVNTCR